MRKKGILIIIAAEILFLITAFMLVLVFTTGVFDGRAQPETPPPSEPNTTATAFLPNGDDRILITADVDVKGRTVTVRQTIQLLEPTEKLQICFYAENYAEVTFLGASLPGGLEQFYSLEKPIKSITASEPTRLFGFEYRIELKNSGDMLSAHDTIIQLVNFLAIPIVGDVFSVSIPYLHPRFGDPFLYDVYDYIITLTCDVRYDISAPGFRRQTESGGRRTAVFNASGLRDFPVVLTTGMSIDKIPYHNIDIYYIGGTKPRAFVENAIRFGKDNIAPFPYDELFIVRAQINPLSGQEFSTMIFLAERLYTGENLQSITYHEVFHQWFYGLVKTDSFSEPFLDEGIAVALDSILRNAERPPNYRIGNFAYTELRSFGSREDFFARAYAEAGNYFYDIYRQLGERNFFRLLAEICKQYANRMFYFRDWEMLLEEITGNENF
jgi:hypothetical protein